MTDLLPYNRSGLEAALSDALGPRLLGDTGGYPAADLGIAGFKVYSIQDAVVPWLVWEYGLDELMPYLSDPRRAIVEGVAWQRLRGTSAALTMAMGWLGTTPDVIEETTDPWRWWGVQIDPGRVLTPVEVRNFVGVATLSLPARARLQRVYHDLDWRAGRFDMPIGNRLLLDDWSGVDLDGVRQSFRTFHAVAFPADEPVVADGVTVIGWGGRQFADLLPRFDGTGPDGAAEESVAIPVTIRVTAASDGGAVDTSPRPWWFLPLRLAARDGHTMDSVIGVADGWSMLVPDGPAPRFDATDRLDTVNQAWSWWTPEAVGVAALNGVLPLDDDAVVVTGSRIDTAGIVVAGDSVIARFDVPAPPEAYASATGTVSDVVYDDDVEGWGSGPWLQQPWENASYGVTMTMNGMIGGGHGG